MYTETLFGDAGSGVACEQEAKRCSDESSLSFNNTGTKWRG